MGGELFHFGFFFFHLIVLQALHFSDTESCQLLVDDGGDATLLIHRGFEAENNASILDEPTDNAELKIVNSLLKRLQKSHPGYWHKVMPIFSCNCASDFDF